MFVQITISYLIEQVAFATVKSPNPGVRKNWPLLGIIELAKFMSKLVFKGYKMSTRMWFGRRQARPEKEMARPVNNSAVAASGGKWPQRRPQNF